MSLPPDGRRPLPWEPPGQPTPPADDLESPGRPDEPVADEPPAGSGPTSEPATPPSGPLISWTPSGGSAPGGSAPGGTAPDGRPPTVGWAPPGDLQRPSPVAGYLVAGPGARIVAYVIDGLMLGILGIVLVGIADPSAYAIDAGGDGGTASPSAASLLAKIIILGLEFIYFVGMWTSRGRATLGMRLLRVRVIDATADRALGVTPAIARWVLLTGAIGLLGLLPIAAGFFGILSLLWVVVLLVSVLTDPLRQGIHDRAAGSLVVQREGDVSNTAVVGCVVIVILFVILPIVSLIFLGGQIQDIVSEGGQSI
jgi:uncharacterized RDD family membrane protein YckC